MKLSPALSVALPAGAAGAPRHPPDSGSWNRAMEKMEAFSWFHGAALTGVRADAAALAKSNTTRSAEFSAVHAASPVSGDTIVFPVRTASAAVDISLHHRGITLPAGLNAERATAGMSGPGPGLAARLLGRLAG